MSTKANKENVRDYLKLGDELLEEVARVNKLTWNVEDMLLKDAWGNSMNWDDMETYSIFVPTQKGNIHQILFFGDGTIEFQYEHCDEAFNWADLELEDLRKVIETLRNVK